MPEFFPIGDDGLRAEVTLSQPPRRAFLAWSTPAEFGAWFRGSEDGHLVIHDFDFREGGGFEVTMVSGNGHEATLTGTYLSIIPDRHLSFTWSWKTDEGFSPQMIVEIEFDQADIGTKLTILHRPFLSLEDRDNHHSGWVPCLSNLESYLKDGTE